MTAVPQVRGYVRARLASFLTTYGEAPINDNFHSLIVSISLALCCFVSYFHLLKVLAPVACCLFQVLLIENVCTGCTYHKALTHVLCCVFPVSRGPHHLLKKYCAGAAALPK
jgi:hypothetical protein